MMCLIPFRPARALASIAPLSKLTALALCGALVVAATGCQKKKQGSSERPPRPVVAATAQMADVPLYVDEIGKCDASATVLIQPQISGEIVEVHFQDGAEVAKGDLLFTLDPRPYEAALAKAKASLEQNRAKAAYDNAQLQRNKELQRSKAIALQALDSAVSNARVSQAAVAADEAEVKVAELNLEYCTIRSPISGRTSKRRVDAGNVVEANKTQLLLIQQQDPIYVGFTVAEGSLPKVRHYLDAGTLKVEAAFADDAQTKRAGHFDFLDSGVQGETGTVWMRAVVNNDDRLFWPGQFVNVRLLLDTLKGAVLVPAEAVQVSKKGPYVFVIKADSTVELRSVEPGQRQGENVVVKSGVAVGERVVVTGHVTLSPGAKVRIVDRSGAALPGGPEAPASASPSPAPTQAGASKEPQA